MTTVKSRDMRMRLGVVLAVAAAELVVALRVGRGDLLVGVGIPAAVAILVMGLIRPKWLVSTFYPAIWIVGGVPIVLGEQSISLERVLVVAGGIGIIVAIVARRATIRLPLGVYSIGVAIWLGAALVSLVAAPSLAGLSQVSRYVQKVLMGWLLLMAFDTFGEARAGLRWYLVASIAAAIVAVGVAASAGSLTYIRESSFGAGETLGESMVRGIARAGAANTLAIWLALSEARCARSRAGRRMWLAVGIGLSAAALLALRREVLITVPIVLSVWLFLETKEWRRILLRVAAIMLVLMLAVSVSVPEWSTRIFEETQTNLTTGSEDRLDLLVFTWRAFLASPWVGHGPGQYGATQLRYPQLLPDEIYYRDDALAPHNAFSLVAVESGIAGIVGLAVMLIGVGWPLFRAWRDASEENKPVFVLALAVYVNLLIRVSFGAGVTDNSVWFWIGALTALAFIGRPAPQDSRSSDPAISRNRM